MFVDVRRICSYVALALFVTACGSDEPAPIELFPTVEMPTSIPIEVELITDDAATLEPGATPAVAFTPAQVGQSPSILLDDFEAHRWTLNAAAGSVTPQIRYSPLHTTQGSHSLHIQTPLDPAPSDLDNNTARVDVTLPEPEDWSAHEIVTLDIYMVENPTGLAEAKLYLTNSAGEQAETPLILGWQLFQWENYQMTFPLTGNTHRLAAIPPEILSDVKTVGLSITRFSDTGYGTPYEELNFYLDNVRLGGHALWETFDAPRWDWQGETIGITHNPGGGALRFVEQVTGSPTSPIASAQPMQAVIAKVRGTTALDLNLTMDGETLSVESTPVQAPDAAGWQTLMWELPQAVAANSITTLTFQAPNAAPVYLDTLELVANPQQPFDLRTQQLGTKTDITWRNPLQTASATVQVMAQGTAEQAAVVVCEAATTTAIGRCTHEKLSDDLQNYTYSVRFAEAATAGATTTANRQIIRVQPNGADFEIGFNADNGALAYVQNVVTGEILSTGNLNDTLWQLVFLDEETLPTLSARQFSAQSETHNFSFNAAPFQLIYTYNEAGRQLEMVIDVVALDAQRFDLKASLLNQTGFAIRTVELPYKLMFQQSMLDRVLLPIQEGLVLLPEFYAENRATTLARPPLFADVLAYEGATGDLAVYMVQDSLYQADLLPGHPAGTPMFQPNNLSTGGIDDDAYFQFDMVTYIPTDTRWDAGTLRFSIDRDFRQVAQDYRIDNGIDQFPSLEAKLAASGTYDALAQSPILAVEMYKSVEWQKVAEGEAWTTIREDWLNRLPDVGVIHLTHWQKGRDWYDLENENHKVEDDHPEALPIWWERYGSEEDFNALLAELAARDVLTMPFTNWSVWNTYDPETLAIPDLAETPAATTKLRGTDYPYIEYKGYVVKPWAADVQDRNTRMFTTYTDTYPQDLMFVDMTAERSWRYIRMDDNTTISAAAYTQAVINENLRLSQQKPLFTEGVFDQLGGSITGYAQTHQQKFWNQILAHLGQQHQHWATYPFAADVLHDKVAFYQHDLNLEIWPAESRALATYYALSGYNYIIDVTKHLDEDEATIWALDAIQKSVNARTFGQPLLTVETLADDYAIRRTTWGAENNPLEIVANFDVDQTAESYLVDGYSIAPDGFLARTLDGKTTAGIFAGQFNGVPLADGVHWITVEQTPAVITIKHPIGTDTPLQLTRPAAWVDDAAITMTIELADRTIVEANTDMLTVNSSTFTVFMPQVFADQIVRKVYLTYAGAVTAASETAIDDLTLAPDQTAPTAPQGSVSWAVDATSIAEWGGDNTVWTASDAGLTLAQDTTDGAIGKAESTPFLVDPAGTPTLRVDISDLSLNSRLVVQVQEAFGDYVAYDAAVITDPANYALDLSALLTDDQANPYIVVLWLEGTQATVTFDAIQLESAAAGEQAATTAVAWQEQFDATIASWPSDNLTAEVTNGQVAIGVTDATIGYGKIETPPFVVDLATAATLTLDVAALDPATAFTVQIQEQFGDYTPIDLQTDVTAATPLEIDLSPFAGTEGANPYRVVIWVSGAGTLTLDAITLSVAP